MKSVSIVINTLNRAPDLAKALESFKWLDARAPFEVIVVNGPSTDYTAQVLAEWGDRIRSYRCEAPNLSQSRNIGISAASGDIVAFIDDDGIPEPEWIDRLSSAYADEAVGAAGGFVYDHTGHAYQYRFGTADRLGNAVIDLERPSEHLNFPYSFTFPHLLGTNSSFRRSALLEVGGFDEEFEYFLDETDVLARVVDAGYVVKQLDDAYVHHKFAPSHLRGTNRVLKNRYPILKNKVYYCIKHGRRFVGMDGVMHSVNSFFADQRRELGWLIDQAMATPKDLAELENNIDRAVADGMKRGLEARPVSLPPVIDANYRAPFAPFEALNVKDRLCIVFVTGDFPPNRSGGIATFTADLARGLAALGHTIHVVTRSSDFDRVDFENGVWLHRILTRPQARDPALSTDIPDAIWHWSATARAEVRRIGSHRRIDCVEAPIWDCEGVAFLSSGEWPTVISLQTTLSFWLDSHPEQANDQVFMNGFGLPMLRLERQLLERADGIRAISAAIRADIEARYEMRFDDRRVHVLPLGIGERVDIGEDGAPAASASGAVEVLFVGRLEKRKGIDTLLGAVPLVLARCPDVFFRVVGDDSLVVERDLTFRTMFEDVATAEERAHVCFNGKLDDSALSEAYDHCDLFVAPSRYESFGLVYVEAMRAGKPVVGCRVGGVAEVVDNGSGILVEPDDVFALASAIVRLVEDTALRRAMGTHGRCRFKSHFDAAIVSSRSIALFCQARDVHGCVR